MVLPTLIVAMALASEPVATESVEVTRVNFGYASAYLLRGADGVVLVDAGLLGSASSILRAAKRIDTRPEDIDLVVVTFVHGDHAGGVAEMARRTGAKVAVHAAGRERLAVGRGAPTVPTTFVGRLIASVASRHRLPAYQADLVVEDRLDLSPWGIPGFVMATPGHAPGHQGATPTRFRREF